MTYIQKYFFTEGNILFQYFSFFESKRLKEDSYAKIKYDSTANQDNLIIEIVHELSQNYDVSMTEISLAWLQRKVTSSIVGSTKYHHIDGE